MRERERERERERGREGESGGAGESVKEERRELRERGMLWDSRALREWDHACREREGEGERDMCPQETKENRERERETDIERKKDRKSDIDKTHKLVSRGASVILAVSVTRVGFVAPIKIHKTLSFALALSLCHHQNLLCLQFFLSECQGRRRGGASASSGFGRFRSSNGVTVSRRKDVTVHRCTPPPF